MRHLEAWALVALLVGLLVGKVALMVLSGPARTGAFLVAAVLAVVGVGLYAKWFRTPDRDP